MTLSRLSALLLLLVLSTGAAGGDVSARLQQIFGGGEEEEILHPDVAFQVFAEPGAAEARVVFEVEDGYYLYRDKFAFEVTEGEARVDEGTLTLPQGHLKDDEIFGQVEVNTGTVAVNVPLVREPGSPLPVTLSVRYQGCKENSVCYPPMAKELPLMLSAWDGVRAIAAAAGSSLSGQDAISRDLKERGFIGSLVAFFGFGLLLSLTPCVFPMVPILSGILIGQGTKATVGRGFIISLSYVLAMAVTYAVLGVIAGSLRINLQAASQMPWVIVLFSAVFVALALAMFGVFELQLPDRLRQSLDRLVQRQSGGTLKGAAVMGVLSALIAGPCVAPPLAGALLYITQTGDAVLGGAALFFMGLGFGVPLLIMGASAGTLLPRAGPWMMHVRRAFGVVMLGVAVWLLGRIIPGPAELVLWALLFVGTAVWLGAFRAPAPGYLPQLFRGLGVALLVYAGTLLVGAAAGNDDVLRPLAGFAGGKTEVQRLPFRRVATLDALKNELAAARSASQPAMLDFYADWCVECVRMERTTFQDPRVRNRLREMVLLQADVTHYGADAREMLEAWELFGPPAILFFDREAQELRALRITGYAGPDEFLAALDKVLKS
jgi:thiol:disulfide interchange protein DsbD